MGEALHREALIEEIQIREELARRKKARLRFDVFQMLYEWQLDFVASTKDHFESCLCAANQIGKSLTGCAIDAFHLTGDYPDTWPGHRFDYAPLVWCLGYSMEKTRDLLQKKLFGEYKPGEGFEGGLVPKDRIVGWETAGGVANAMRTVRVKHASGGESSVQFWSYTQGQHAIMGDVVDWVHVDEEPKDQTIRPQLITRTANGDRGLGGRIIYTLTPENGKTDLIVKFMEERTKYQFFMQKGWDDAPHMTPEKRERLLEQYPAHQRDMRTKGVPMLGHGRIYDIGDEFIECDAFPIPDYWKFVVGMDFGYDHPQAFVKLAVDIENDMVYVTNSWKREKCSANTAWGAVKHWVGNLPVAWPHDGLQHEKGKDDPKTLSETWKDAGFNMYHSHATWEKGGNSVENGIHKLRERMQRGTLKIFKGQPDLMNELRQYHREESGKIKKVNDDLLDALRYAYMMKRIAEPEGGEEFQKIKFLTPWSR
jgi:phage terminase large subunit-like protein